jgi:hypothetical protein
MGNQGSQLKKDELDDLQRATHCMIGCGLVWGACFGAWAGSEFKMLFRVLVHWFLTCGLACAPLTCSS